MESLSVTKPDVRHLLLGARVRHARLAKGMRQQALADVAGCSKSMLSKIEADRAVPSLPALQRIAHALDIDLASLFSGPVSNSDIVFRHGRRPILEIDPLRRGEGIKYERLIPFGQGVLLEANIHIIQPQGGREDLIQHQGEELGLVLEGQLELTVGALTYLAHAQDFVLFQLGSWSYLPQSWSGSDPSRMGQHAACALGK